MFRWLRSLLKEIFASRTSQVTRQTRNVWTRPRLDIPRYSGAGDIPPLHWKACHPATINRFKAEFACPNGHGLTLKGHSIESDGTVHPSVVCPTSSCEFHDFVRLSRWDAGDIG